MFFKKLKSERKIQSDSLKFLFDIQNQLLRFNWRLMDHYTESKNIDLIDSMNFTQDAINSLNKAQNSFTNISKKNEKIVDIKTSMQNKKWKILTILLF